MNIGYPKIFMFGVIFAITTVSSLDVGQLEQNFCNPMYCLLYLFFKAHTILCMYNWGGKHRKDTLTYELFLCRLHYLVLHIVKCQLWNFHTNIFIFNVCTKMLRMMMLSSSTWRYWWLSCGEYWDWAMSLPRDQPSQSKKCETSTSFTRRRCKFHQKGMFAQSVRNKPVS